MAKIDTNLESKSKVQLGAVLFADLVSYTLHVVQRETEVRNFLRAAFKVFEELCIAFEGKIIKTTGDGIIIVFESASASVGFALTVQEAIAEMQSPEQDFAFRIGIHAGEIHWDAGDIFGHIVNVAARLEALAPPRGVMVSQDVVALVGNKQEFEFESAGLRKLKNIPEPMIVYIALTGQGSVARRQTGILTIEALGGLKLSSPGASVGLPNSLVVQGILGILALSIGRTAPVDHLATILKPDLPRPSSRRSVLRAIRTLQERLGVALHLEHDTLSLDPTLVVIDVEDVESDIRRGRIAPILIRREAWSDQLLQGLNGISANFDAWLAVVSADWRDRIAAALETALDRCDDVEDLTLRDVATALLRIENGHERAARGLIQHLVARGNHGAAVQVFETLTDVLRERFDVAPRAGTEAALKGVQDGITRPQQSSTPLRLQVRSFEAQDPSWKDMLASFRSELMAGLSCFRSWSVVEGAQETRGSIAPDYALRAIQTGKDRFVMSLVDALTGDLVWSDTFATDTGEIGRACRQAIGRIAATLEVYISTDRSRRDGSDTGHAVIDAWLSADRLAEHWTPESHDAAAAAFRKLIDEAPAFSPAYASVAGLLNVRHIVRPGMVRDANAAHEAHRLADKAVSLDPLDARNQLHTAWSAALDGSFDKASIHMNLAARLNPHSPRTLISCAMGFSFLGEHELATELVAHSIECAPVLMDYQWGFAASVYFLSGDDGAALEALERAGDSIVDLQGWAAVILARQGRIAEAASAFSRMTHDVAPYWAGPSDPAPAEIRDWFVAAYPLRRDTERTALRDALSDAISGLNAPI